MNQCLTVLRMPSVCLYAYTGLMSNFTKIFCVYCRWLWLSPLRRHCNKLCTSGFVDSVILWHIGPMHILCIPKWIEDGKKSQLCQCSDCNRILLNAKYQKFPLLGRSLLSMIDLFWYQPAVETSLVTIVTCISVAAAAASRVSAAVGEPVESPVCFWCSIFNFVESLATSMHHACDNYHKTSKQSCLAIGHIAATW